MAWIESHQSLRNHPKTLKVCGILQIDRHKFLGHLHCLWWWALDIADTDGVLPAGCTATMIGEAAEVSRSRAGAFVAALSESGFMEQRAADDRWVLHDWYDYAGKLNARRERNRDAMRAARGAHVGTTSLSRVKLPTKPTNQPYTTKPEEAWVLNQR